VIGSSSEEGKTLATDWREEVVVEAMRGIAASKNDFLDEGAS